MAKRRDTRYQPELRARAQRLYVDDGLSLREVATRMGISKTRVTALLEEAGVKLRRQGRPKRRAA